MATKATAIVTGSSSGIGRAVAVKLLSDGWKVFGLDRTPGEPLSPEFHPVSVDLTDFDALAATLAALPDASAIVHAAGFMRAARLGELQPDDGEAMWRIHVDAAAVLANTMLPRMPDGGRIVLIGSRTAAGAPGRCAATRCELVGRDGKRSLSRAPRAVPGATTLGLFHPDSDAAEIGARDRACWSLTRLCAIRRLSRGHFGDRGLIPAVAQRTARTVQV